MNPLLLDLPEKIKIDRCIVRPYKPGDGTLLFEAVEASREFLKPTMAWAHQTQSLEETELRVRTIFGNWANRATDLTMGIFDLEETRVIGGTGFHRIDWDKRIFEIGYWIRPDESGKGLMTDIVRALTEYAFLHMDAVRVHIRCDADNIKSAAVARRLSFVEEGRLLNAGRKWDGTPTDHLSFGMTPQIWKKLQSGAAKDL